MRYFAGITTLSLVCAQLLALTTQQARALLAQAGTNAPRELSRVERRMEVVAQSDERLQDGMDPRPNRSPIAAVSAPPVPVAILAAKLDSAESLPGSRANMKLLRALAKKNAQMTLAKKSGKDKDTSKIAAQLRQPLPAKLVEFKVESARDVTYRNLGIVVALMN